jgi:hypothetical protein
MRRNKKLDSILDECLEHLLVKGETIEQCLKSYPEQATELKPLLQTALKAKNASVIQPRPEFRARARYQLRSAIGEVQTKRKPRFSGWQPRWATAIAIVLILLLAGGSTVAAAGNSMPDEPLYPMKLATEQIRLKLTPADLGKAQLYASFADKRVLEITRMAKEGRAELVERTAQRLDTHLAMIASLLSVQEKETEVMMAPPAARAPAPVEKAGGKPLSTKQANRRAKLRTAVAHYAIYHPAALRAALDKAPESAKPALRRAITRSVVGYEQVLKALE